MSSASPSLPCVNGSEGGFDVRKQLHRVTRTAGGGGVKGAASTWGLARNAKTRMRRKKARAPGTISKLRVRCQFAGGSNRRTDTIRAWKKTGLTFLPPPRLRLLIGSTGVDPRF
jgi:hypothetical protein